MKAIDQLVKSPLRAVLSGIGIYESALQTRDFFSGKSYRNQQKFTAILNDIAVDFSTEDRYSNAWFFPRYLGGLLHEQVVTKLLIDSLGEAQCFVDVGTNLGWYSCMAARHMPGGKVYGFEMDDLNFALLQKNIALNSLTNIQAYNLAVSDAPAQLSYRREAQRPSPVFRLQAGTEAPQAGELRSVEAIALDSFLEAEAVRPDVIKIDVEGAEMGVLRGMKRILAEVKPTLFLEIHPATLPQFGTSTAEVLSQLIENGYQVFEIEEMRSQDSAGQLKPLGSKSVLENNTMLYAIAP